MWAKDPDRHVALVEDRLYRSLRAYLYGVHLDVHRALGLPAMDRQAVLDAYHVTDLPQLLVKAEQSKAAATFAALLAQPRAARKPRDLADSLASSWFERAGIEDEAHRAVVVANLTGRIQAQGHLPADYAGWRRYAEQITDPKEGTVLLQMERACIHATQLDATTRGVVAGTVTDALLRGDSPATLATALTQRFGTLNRDARRLAITEIAFARASGYLAGLPEGEKVEWFTAAGACRACEGMNARTFTVRRGPGDGQKDVWPGKHNVGRLVADRWPAIPLHPNCRCRWVRPAARAEGVSQSVLDALSALEND